MIKKVSAPKHILIVDDDVSVAKMLSMLLETRGYSVNIVRSGKEALSSISNVIDLIILDLVLPDLEGFEVCRRLKENQQTRHIPIIMLSAKMLSNDVIEGLYMGADDYLRKPFEYEELVARMEAVMRRSSLFHQDSPSYYGMEMIITELRKIIQEGLIVPFFQPIYQISPFKVYGFEVLSRPCTNTILSNPEILFKCAIKYGVYQDLEILAWRKALEKIGSLPGDERVFLNCNPYLVEGPKFLAVKSLFDESYIKPDRVILEITERSAISDFKSFYDHLRRYRDCGFKFAVDDVGGGYASLESIVETKPEVVKIDRHIVTDLNSDPFKQSIVKFIVTFCKEHNILSIAEGIETKKDFLAVKALGVDAVQGYYLYKPTSQLDIEKMTQSAAAL